MWVDWLHHPCCLGNLHCFRAEDKITCGPTCGRTGCITPAVSVVPTASKRGTKSDVGPHVGGLATSPMLSRGSPTLQSGYITPAISGVRNAPKQGTKSEEGPHVGGLATSPMLSRGSPTLHSRGQHHKRVHMWAVWLHHPCCLGGPQHFKVVDKIRIGPSCGQFGDMIHLVRGVLNASKRWTKSNVGAHVGGLATSRLLSQGSQRNSAANVNRDDVFQARTKRVLLSGDSPDLLCWMMPPKIAAAVLQVGHDLRIPTCRLPLFHGNLFFPPLPTLSPWQHDCKWLQAPHGKTRGSLQKAEHKNTAQNLGRQYKVSPRPVPMPAIEADPALQESHGCPPATRTQSQHIAVNRRD